MPTECMICKAMNADTASFCNNCGARLGGVPGQTPAKPSSSQPQGLPEAPPQREFITQRPSTLPEHPPTSGREWTDPSSAGWDPLQPAAQPPASDPLGRFLAVARGLVQPATAESRLEGTVRRFYELGDRDSRGRLWYVRTFLLESFDALGNRRPPVQVEMRALRFDGWINEGDEVVITQSKREGGRVVASELRNITTRTTVRAKGSSLWPPPPWVWNVIWLIGLGLVLYQCLRM